MVQPQPHSLPHSTSGKPSLTQHEPNCSWQKPLQMVQTVTVRLVFNQLKWTYVTMLGAHAALCTLFRAGGPSSTHSSPNSTHVFPPIFADLHSLLLLYSSALVVAPAPGSLGLLGLVSLVLYCVSPCSFLWTKRLLNVSKENASEICNHNKESSKGTWNMLHFNSAGLASFLLIFASLALTFASSVAHCTSLFRYICFRFFFALQTAMFFMLEQVPQAQKKLCALIR